TFHGRDIFAPAAAHLARGDPLESLGETVKLETLVRLGGYQPEATPAGLRGQVMVVDRYGNLRTNIPCAKMPAAGVVAVYDRQGRVVARIRGLERTFGDVEEGALVAYCGSAGTIEVAMRGASAAAHLGCGPACGVEVSR
ncbi:MAG: S-adenosyl-l-methionine hydroxide adenosyltransferase family protein, partial [Anaerolineae bacterium]